MVSVCSKGELEGICQTKGRTKPFSALPTAARSSLQVPAISLGTGEEPFSESVIYQVNQFSWPELPSLSNLSYLILLRRTEYCHLPLRTRTCAIGLLSHPHIRKAGWCSPVASILEHPTTVASASLLNQARYAGSLNRPVASCVLR